MEALKETSRLIQRYSIVERTYSRDISHAMERGMFERKNLPLENAIISLYSAILVYQALALGHLEHRNARRILSDTFKPDQWENRLQGIKIEEGKCDKLLDTHYRESVQLELHRQSGQVEEMMKSFQQQLVEMKVTRLELFFFGWRC